MRAVARAFRIVNWWVALPVASVVLVLAEFSRYTAVAPSWLQPLLAQKTQLAALAVVLLTWLVLGLVSRQVRLRWAAAWWLGVPLLLAAWSLLGLAWSPAAEARTYLVEFWLFGLTLTLVLGTVARSIKNRWPLVTAAFVGVSVVIAIAVVEKITDTHLPLSNLHNPYREQWAVTSVFINQNNLAACLAIFLPLIGAAILSHRRYLRWVAAVIVTAGLVVLFFTGSTLAWLGLIVTASVLAVVELVYARRIKRKLLVGGVGLLVGFGVVAGTWIVLPSSVTDRFSVAAEGVGKSVAERVELARVGTQLVLEHPLRGHGPAAAEAAVRAAGKTRVQNLHSFAMEVAVNFGLPAAALLIAWIVSLGVAQARSLRRLAAEARPEFHRVAATLAMLVGFTFVQLAPSTFTGIRAPWILLGLALALTRAYR